MMSALGRFGCFQRRKWRGGFCRLRASSPPPAQQGCELAALACLAFLNARQWLGQQLIEARTQDVDPHPPTDRFRFHSLIRAAVLVAVVALDGPPPGRPPPFLLRYR